MSHGCPHITDIVHHISPKSSPMPEKTCTEWGNYVYIMLAMFLLRWNRSTSRRALRCGDVTNIFVRILRESQAVTVVTTLHISAVRIRQRRTEGDAFTCSSQFSVAVCDVDDSRDFMRNFQLSLDRSADCAVSSVSLLVLLRENPQETIRSNSRGLSFSLWEVWWRCRRGLSWLSFPWLWHTLSQVTLRVLLWLDSVFLSLLNHTVEWAYWRAESVWRRILGVGGRKSHVVQHVCVFSDSERYFSDTLAIVGEAFRCWASELLWARHGVTLGVKGWIERIAEKINRDTCNTKNVHISRNFSTTTYTTPLFSFTNLFTTHGFWPPRKTAVHLDKISRSYSWKHVTFSVHPNISRITHSFSLVLSVEPTKNTWRSRWWVCGRHYNDPSREIKTIDEWFQRLCT